MREINIIILQAVILNVLMNFMRERYMNAHITLEKHRILDKGIYLTLFFFILIIILVNSKEQQLEWRVQ